MKRSLVRTIGLPTLLLSVAVVALAGDRDHRACSIAGVKGAWGYSESGTLYHPVLGAAPYASVGSYTVDHDGNLSGARNASVGNTGVQFATIEGTATVNPDCTGELHLSFYNASGVLLSTAVKFVVYVDDSTEARSLITDLVLPDGTTHVPAVLVTDAKKQSPDRSGEHEK
jgi:hypothetical protein